MNATNGAADVAQVRLAKPTPQQAAWQDLEIGMFIHFGHNPKLEDVNPDKLDTDEWVRVAKSLGAGYFMFVAKHEDGFCWWQTDTSPYGVKHTPWRGGKGDVVRDLAASCRKLGIKLGLYLSPGDDVYKVACHGVCKQPEEQDKYNRIYRQQLTELLSNYGEITEVWFDGSTCARVDDIIGKYCPKAMVFQSTSATIRWVGNEEGWAPDPGWNSVPLEKANSGISTAADGSPDGDAWLPNECDTRSRIGAWFWSPDPGNRLKTLDELVSLYYRSVGHGAEFLLNFGPDPSGRIPDDDIKRASEFGAEIKRRFGKSIAETSGKGPMVELALAKATKIDHVITMENILEGERVREYAVEGMIDGKWKELCRGTAIGHKKIDRFEEAAVTKVRLRCLKSAEDPLIRKLAVYLVAAGPSKEGVKAGPADKAQTIWEWSESTIGGEWQTVDIDVTPFCKDACLYELDLRWAGGVKPFELRWMHFVFDGTVLPGFVTPASEPGGPRHILMVTALAKSLGLRLMVRVPEGQKASRGTLTIRKHTV